MNPLLTPAATEPLSQFGNDSVWVVILKAVLIFVLLVLLTLFNIWFERRVVGRMQHRIGPNVNGPFGLLQSLADGAFARAFRFVDERIGLSTDGSGFGLATDKPIPQASNTTASLDLVATDEAADRLDLTINYRVGIANTAREIEDKSGAIAAGYGAVLREIGAVFDAYYLPDGDALLGVAAQSYRDVQQHDPLLLALGATTYVKAAPNLVSFGPVDLVEDGIFFHTVNEQMPVASLTRNAVLFADVLQKLIQAEQAPRR